MEPIRIVACILSTFNWPIKSLDSKCYDLNQVSNHIGCIFVLNMYTPQEIYWEPLAKGLGSAHKLLHHYRGWKRGVKVGESSATNSAKVTIVWLGLQRVGGVSTNLDPATVLYDVPVIWTAHIPNGYARQMYDLITPLRWEGKKKRESSLNHQGFF